LFPPRCRRRAHTEVTVWSRTTKSQCYERRSQSPGASTAEEARKERTGVIVTRVAVWPLWASLPREQSGGTQGSYAARQCSSLSNELAPAASSPGIPRIDMEFAESYYSYKTAIFATTGRLRGGSLAVSWLFLSLGQLALFSHPAFMKGARFRAFLWVHFCLLCEATYI